MIYLFHESTSNVLIGVVVKSIVRIGFIAGDTVAHLKRRSQLPWPLMLQPGMRYHSSCGMSAVYGLMDEWMQEETGWDGMGWW